MTRKTKKPLLRAALLAVALLLALTACGQPATEPSSSTSESAGGLGETAVKAIALAHAQLAEDQTEELKTARRMENGLLQYDVSFTSGGVRYLYVIDGASGAILSNQTDTPSPSGEANGGAYENRHPGRKHRRPDRPGARPGSFHLCGDGAAENPVRHGPRP